MQVVRQETWFYTEGGSDKVYQIQIEDAGDGLYHVNGYNGRRGNALAQQPKTKGGPVNLDKANALFEAERKNRIRKGYTLDESGSTYTGTDKADRKVDLVPQLLNAIDEAAVEFYLKDPHWIMQEKMDGVRIMGRVIETHTDKVEVSNRKCLTVSAPTRVLREISEFPDATVTDGELVGATYWLFDILQWGEMDYRGKPYRERFRLFSNYESIYNDTITPDQRPMRVVPTAFTEEEKRALYAEIRKRRGEGVVFKREDATYQGGRPASGGTMMKFKFWESATCVVTSHNAKNSVKIAVLGGNGERVPVGNVTIPVGRPLPPVDSYIEVKYLYAYRLGSLFQPQYLGPREDKEQADLYDTLKFKADGADEDSA